MTRAHLAAAALLAAVAVPASAQHTGSAGAPCDRACLTGIADGYFAALADHDPSRAPLAPGVRFTENARVLTVGENPFDFESMHIFKVRGGRIHDIEAMGVSLPYRSKNGWSDFLR